MELGDGIGAIATLLAILGAFKISRDWRSQKGSEVVSLQAKEIFILIEDLPKHMNIVLEDMLKIAINNHVPNDFDSQRFIDFRTVNINIIKRLELIKFKNKDRNTIKVIEVFEKNYENYATFYHQSTPINLDNLLNSKDIYEKSFEELKEYMYKYTLFKKTI